PRRKLTTPSVGWPHADRHPTSPFLDWGVRGRRGCVANGRRHREPRLLLHATTGLLAVPGDHQLPPRAVALDRPGPASDDCPSHASYLIGDESSGLAAVVDPRRDVAAYVDDAAHAGLRIAYVLETHFHADFLSGHLELADATGAEIVFSDVADTEFPARHAA